MKTYLQYTTLGYTLVGLVAKHRQLVPHVVPAPDLRQDPSGELDG